MDDVLDATFYNDDFLTRTLTSSVLYDKSHLDLTFVENNNCVPAKREESAPNNAEDSPNLDFLKLGSPDLEQMFMNINENESNFSNEDNDSDVSNTTAAFNIRGDIPTNGTENCFTDALQQLHDKQDALPQDLVDVTYKIGKENLRSKLLDGRRKPNALPPQPPKYRSQNPIKQLYHNPQRRNQNSFQQQSHVVNKNMQPNINNMNHQNLSQKHISIPEQIALNNQMAIINNMNAHQMQQQQEIAFLTQAMGYEREPSNLLNNASGYPPPQQPPNLATHGQLPGHMQQKLLEQQLIHQQQLNGSGFVASDNPLQQHMQQMDALNSMGIDDPTLKRLMENPHMVPVNLELQELIKRERKKLRNRVASSKCRKRKLEREGRLEDRVKDLKEKNIELNAVANALKQQICDLKQRVMDHVGEGCQIVLPS